MKPRDAAWLSGLLAAGVWIWVRDLAWTVAADEVLPVLAALPLFAWLAAPWQFQPAANPPAARWLAAAAGAGIVGIALDSALLLAIGWTAAFWAWLAARLDPAARRRAQRLLPLPLLAFPWLALNDASLGWWFRLSGAWTAEHVFTLAGLAVTREGTHLLVQGLPISVDASCAGLRVLQALLIAGTAIAFLQVGDRRGYWWSLPALAALAWLANTCRILVLSGAALTVSPEFAQGWFHSWGGWMVLMLMFLFSTAAFSLWRRFISRPA